jgi:hypothetical protein
MSCDCSMHVHCIRVPQSQTYFESWLQPPAISFPSKQYALVARWSCHLAQHSGSTCHRLRHGQKVGTVAPRTAALKLVMLSISCLITDMLKSWGACIPGGSMKRLVRSGAYRENRLLPTIVLIQTKEDFIQTNEQDIECDRFSTIHHRVQFNISHGLPHLIPFTSLLCRNVCVQSYDAV